MKEVISGSFEWDGEKNDANAQKHGIRFEQATGIFEHPYLRLRSSFESETRWVALGRFQEQITAVIYTERQSRVRIISARMARKHEREIYNDRIGNSARPS
jgi:uncharacterized DUF497 family protein